MHRDQALNSTRVAFSTAYLALTSVGCWEVDEFFKLIILHENATKLAKLPKIPRAANNGTRIWFKNVSRRSIGVFGAAKIK